MILWLLLARVIAASLHEERASAHSARGRSQGTTHKSHARARPRFRFAMRERA